MVQEECENPMRRMREHLLKPAATKSGYPGGGWVTGRRRGLQMVSGPQARIPFPTIHVPSFSISEIL